MLHPGVDNYSALYRLVCAFLLCLTSSLIVTVILVGAVSRRLLTRYISFNVDLRIQFSTPNEASGDTELQTRYS